MKYDVQFTNQFKKDLKLAKKQNKSTQSHFKDVEKLLKLDLGNTELLAQKEKLLSDAVKETRNTLFGDVAQELRTSRVPAM